jgi:uncharacterized SAM-binding protein YcdF (DUF218 family)
VKPSRETPELRRPARWRDAGAGLVLGALAGLGALQLIREVVPVVGCDALVPLGSAAGAVLACTRARALLWMASAVVVAGLALVGYTPLIDGAIQGPVRSDPLRQAPAVVVLASSVQRDGELSHRAQARIIHGYEVLGQRYAPRLVITRLAWQPGSYMPFVREQMRELGLMQPIDEVGPVADTHDEAVAVAHLARERGWDRVILVTHPDHMRRAAAVFEKAGLPVLCSPCVEGEYDTSDLGSFSARLRAFRAWAHEVIGYQVYRWRGWL